VDVFAEGDGTVKARQVASFPQLRTRITTTIIAQVWECVNAQRRSSFAAISLRLNQFRLERTADRRKHKKIGTQVKDVLEQIPKKEFKDFKSFHADRKQKAKKLEAKYGPKVKKKVKGKTVKLKVQFNPVAKDEKDGDVDFKVVIAPNATIVPGAAAGGGGNYPGSNTDPSSRTIHQLWLDADPANKLSGEGSGDDKERVRLAKEELYEKYKVHGSRSNAKEIVDGLWRYNKGQSPRRFTTALKEFQLNNSAHIHDRHIKGMGILPTENDQALRVIRNKPHCPGRAGFFLSHSAANKSLQATISQHFGSGKNAKWPNQRDQITKTYIQNKGTFNNKMVLLGPLAGGAFNLKRVGSYSLPADFPKYFQHEPVFHVGDPLQSPAAVGERPLWRRDKKARMYNLTNLSNPLTEKLVASETYARVVPDPNIKGGWYINSGWPQ